MSNVKSSPEQGTSKVEKISPVALLDCGQASKATKGVLYLIIHEVAPPPFDRALVWL